MVERPLELGPSQSSVEPVNLGPIGPQERLPGTQIEVEVHSTILSPGGGDNVGGRAGSGTVPMDGSVDTCLTESLGLEGARYDPARVLPSTSLMLIGVGLPQEVQRVAHVDPGSYYNTVDIATFNEIGVPPQQPSRELEGLRSTGLFPHVYGTVLLEVALGPRSVGEGMFVIVDSPSQAFDMVLGEPFLTANGVAVESSRKRMSLRGKNNVCIDIYLSGAPEEALPLYRGIPVVAGETMVIPTGETTTIKTSHCLDDLPLGCTGKRSESRLMLVESLGAGRAHSRDLFVFSGLADAGNWPGHLVVMNQGDGPVTVTTGQTVAHMSSVVEAVAVSDVSGHEINVVLPDPVADREPVDEDPPEIGSSLNPEERERVEALLLDHENVFSKGETDMGCLDVKGHRIELYDHTPIYQKARRFPEVVNAEIEKQCHQLEALDIIEPSKSPFSSPVVPVRKKDGSIRLCVDYRRLNAATKPDKFPLPNLTDSVFGLRGTRYFTSLDLVRGYYQLPLDDSCREYTAFSTPRAHWQFKRLSFGLKNAPAAFQRELQTILSRFPWQRVIVYIDDILILGRTFEEHLELVGKVLSTLAEHGLKVKLKKCQFFCREVHFLGHMVSADGLRKPKDFVESVQSFPKPTTVKEMQRFLGLINFQRKFVEKCAEVVKPLTQVTGGQKKGSRATTKKLVWTPEMDIAFETVKAMIAEDVLLSFPDYAEGSCPLELFTDASDAGVGACLMQRQGGEYKTIAYISTTFNDAQRRYDTTDKELTAIRWAVKTLRAFLYGVDFVVHSDHQPLVYLASMRIVNARLARTLEDLAEFRFVIQYKPGRENVAADALSRMNSSPFIPGVGDVRGEPPPGLKPVGEPIPGGGDSLVLSLTRLLHRQGIDGVPKGPSELRRRIVDELQAHPLLYGIKSSGESKRLRSMRGEGQLMSFEALLAFATLTNCTVYVHYGLGIPLMIRPVGKCAQSQSQRLHLQCLAGVHFNPLEETPEYVVPVVDGHPQALEDGDAALVEDQDRELMAQWQDTRCPNHMSTHLTTIMVRVAGLNLDLCCLVDSGAQCSCISSGVVARLGLKPEGKSTTVLYGFGGGQGVNTEGSVELGLELSVGWTIHQSLTVVAAGMMPYCVILGVDALVSHRIQMDFAGGRIIQTAAVVKFGATHRSPGEDCQMTMISPGEASIPCELNEQLKQDLDSPVGLEEAALGYLDGLLEQEQLRTHQSRDSQLRAVRNAVARPVGLTSNRLSKLFSRHRKRLRVVDGILYLLKGERLIGVVSFPLMVEILLIFHLSLAHAGREKLLHAVSTYVWHPKMSSIAADIARTCHLCQTVKVSVDKAKAPTIKVQTQKPFDLVAVDLVALPMSRGQVCCLVVVDHNSKWLAVVPLANKRADTVAGALCDRIIPSLPRVPRRLLSDNGPEFRGEAFKQRLESLGIEHVMTTPLNPASNGAVERGNRTLLELLRNLESTSSDWTSNLPRAVMTYNHTMHRELGMSPSEYLLTQRHEPCGAPLIPLSETMFWKVGHPAFAPFKARQKVLRKVRFQGNRVENKLQERFEGPFVVKRVNANGVTYVLEHCTTGKEVKEHHNHLKAYWTPPQYLQECSYYRQLYETTEPEQGVHSTGGPVTEDGFRGAWAGLEDTTTESETTQHCEDGLSSVVVRADKEVPRTPEAIERKVGPQSVDLFGAIGSAERGLLHSWMAGENSTQRDVPNSSANAGDRERLINESVWSVSRVSSGLSDVTWNSERSSGRGDSKLDADDSASSLVELTLHLSTTLEYSDGQVQKIYALMDPVPEEMEHTHTVMDGALSQERCTLNLQEADEKTVTVGKTRVKLVDPKCPLRSSPVRTRSRGGVVAYPNVQRRPIEYKRKGLP